MGKIFDKLEVLLYLCGVENNKQTAVEWLVELIECGADLDQIKKCIPKAKEMEKKQIIKAHMNVNDDRDYRMQDVIIKEFAEQYYNEQCGGNK